MSRALLALQMGRAGATYVRYSPITVIMSYPFDIYKHSILMYFDVCKNTDYIIGVPAFCCLLAIAPDGSLA